MNVNVCVALEECSGTTWRRADSNKEVRPTSSACSSRFLMPRHGTRTTDDDVETSSEAQMSVDSDAYNDWCLPHIYDDCSPTNPRTSNLLFGCVSAATVLKNAFVLVQVNRFQQIIGVYTLQAPSYGNKVWYRRDDRARLLRMHFTAR